MSYFEAILRDECGDDFQTTVEAIDKGAAIDLVWEDYPESLLISITSPQEAIDRINRRETLLREEMYND
tara:strand:- start:275 stop:481 length:207 start_codon:yes stop_codon:yes gene_type:complete